MCGISAIFSLSDFKINEETLVEMTNKISHRGPDGEGYVTWKDINSDPIRFGGEDTPSDIFTSDFDWRPLKKKDINTFKFGLGHRRLSIVDLAPAGHQPMSLTSKNLEIVFNGEIYNYLQLKKELIELGCYFKTNTDTEVILHSWDKWGANCLNKFNGMFSFVIFNNITNEVFIARDRFGIKPLYYWVSEKGFVAFASEIKQFIDLPGWCPKLNSQKAYEFLNYGITDHSNETLFEGVYQLRGGEFINCNVFKLQNISKNIKRWYDLKPAKVSKIYETACEQFSELFTDSVGLRRNAAVKVGTGLSGGLDSSSIVCTLNKLKEPKSNLYTFTSTSADKRFDESEYANLVIKKTKSTSYFSRPKLNGFLNEIKKIIWHHDEPFVGATIFAEWEIYKLASKKGIKVTLDGHGADEQLGGYHSFLPTIFAEFAKKNKWNSIYKETIELRKKHGYSYSMPFNSLLKVHTPDIVREFIASKTGKHTYNANWFESNSLGVREHNLNTALGLKTSDFRNYSKSQLIYSSLPQQLKWCDRDSMAHGVESRAPFLDYRLVEFCLGCETKFKFKNGETKKILRDSLKDLLPDKIKNRNSKMGFVTEEYAWIRETHSALFIEMAKDAIIKSQGILNPLAEKKVLDIISGKAPFDFFVWRVIFFGEWLQLFKIQK
jgi:asparagine synthase (glutamine-hydrolysing)